MNDPLRNPFRGVDNEHGYYFYLLVVEFIGVMSAVACGAFMIWGCIMIAEWLMAL